MKTSEWSAEEQGLLEEQYRVLAPSASSALTLYAKIAVRLPKKTIHDVAERAQSLQANPGQNDREFNKKRRVGNEGRSQKVMSNRSYGADSTMGSDDIEGMADSGGFGSSSVSGNANNFPAPWQNYHNFANDSTSRIGMQRLDENVLIINQIRENILNGRIHNNVELMVLFRNNIKVILKWLESHSGPMKQMPPLPVKLNTLFIPNEGEPNESRGSSNSSGFGGGFGGSS